MSSPHLHTMQDIMDEVKKARSKFPDNHKLLAALMEEVGELAQAYLQDKPLEEIYKEAKQVACVAIRIMEEGDADFENKNWEAKP